MAKGPRTLQISGRAACAFVVFVLFLYSLCFCCCFWRDLHNADRQYRQRLLGKEKNMPQCFCSLLCCEEPGLAHFRRLLSTVLHARVLVPVVERISWPHSTQGFNRVVAVAEEPQKREPKQTGWGSIRLACSLGKATCEGSDWLVGGVKLACGGSNSLVLLR